MAVSLEEIKFNYDQSSEVNDAINIRKNASEFINVPEWVRGSCTIAEDSLAAYAGKETRGNTLKIQARFTSTTEKKGMIRAIDPSTTPGGCAGLIVKAIRAIAGNVLGEVTTKNVSFGKTGDTGFMEFELNNPTLWDVGVGVHYTTWKWQYRKNKGSAWTDIETTHHKIYVLLETPKDPWQQMPYVSTNDQLPWTDVMDYSCIWAMGAKLRDKAAGRITEKVYDLGPSVVEYDCPGGGASHYSAYGFMCTDFLDLLKGGPGLGRYVNCSDCATIVSSFANILGCDLWQSRMGYSFELNRLLAIGSSIWQTACGWSGFSYHEVAWKGACDVNDEIFDACLMVDGDNDPHSAPRTALLPVNMKFGNCGDMFYRDRLTTPAGCPNCDPQPSTKQRRTIY